MKIFEPRSAAAPVAGLFESTNRKSKTCPQILIKQRKLKPKCDTFGAWESHCEKKWQCDLTDWFEERRKPSKKFSSNAADDHEELRFRPLPRCSYMEKLHYKEKAAAAAAAWKMEEIRVRKEEEEAAAAAAVAAAAALTLSAISSVGGKMSILEENETTADNIERAENEEVTLLDEDKRFSLASPPCNRKLWTAEHSVQWRQRQEVVQLHRMSSSSNLTSQPQPNDSNQTITQTTTTPRLSYTNRETSKLCANFQLYKCKTNLSTSTNKTFASSNENHHSQFISLVPSKISLLEECLRYNTSTNGGQVISKGASENISTILADYGIHADTFSVLRTKNPSSASNHPYQKESNSQQNSKIFPKKLKETATPSTLKFVTTKNIQPQLPNAEVGSVLLCKPWRGFGQSEIIANKLGIVKEKVLR